MKSMTKKQIRNTINELAKSQGFYSRLDKDLKILEETDKDEYERHMDCLENKGFKDEVDLILFLEQGG